MSRNASAHEHAFAWSAHPSTGWAFWWRWVVATNLGWFPGILIGTRAGAALFPEHALAQATFTAASAALCFGAAQAFALRSALARPSAWLLASVLGWTLGVLLARLLLNTMGAELSPLRDVVAVAFIAGTCIGVAQAPLLAEAVPRWRAWPIVSAIGWGVLFPGAVPGLFLALASRRPRASAPVH